MTVEQSIYAALRVLVADRVYPDFAPDEEPRPYITFQQVGGEPVNFVDSTAPSLKNARVRVNVWADTRRGAAEISGQIETALRDAGPLRTTVLTNALALYDPSTRLRGVSQDFSFWFDS